ncbi:MAG: hypothetical protein RL154_726 [Pseudomonadota bacterium]|jgi:diguanylate cyclase (GGDEF)-like protein/PAS domain S-box-containing protein
MLGIADQLTNGFLIVDESLNIIDWNKWLVAHTGIPKSDAIGKNLIELFPYIDEIALKRKVKTTISVKTPAFYSTNSGYLIKISKEKLLGQTYDYMIQQIKITSIENYAAIIINDHTEIQEAYRRLENLKNQATHYVEIIDRYVNTILTDKNGIIRNVSAAMCELSGYDKEHLIGSRVSVLRHPDTPNDLYQKLWNTISQGKVWQGELKNLNKNGEIFFVKSAIFPIDGYFSDSSYQAVLEDITDKKKIESLTIIDDLTKLYNRRYFNNVFLKELGSAKRNENIFAFFMIDIDFFKQYNDEYGHKAGDDTLFIVAQGIANTLKRSGDLAFRLGGEEFGVIACFKAEDEPILLGELLRQAVYDLQIPHKGNNHNFVTISIGIESYNAKNYNNQDDLQTEIYSKADFALYRAKKLGRNRVLLNTSHK